MKRPLTNKNITHTVDTLCLHAQMSGNSQPSQRQLLDTLTSDIKPLCVAAQQHHNRQTAILQTVLSITSLVVITSCILFNTYSYDRCNYVVIGQLTGHTEIVNNINTLFA